MDTFVRLWTTILGDIGDLFITITLPVCVPGIHPPPCLLVVLAKAALEDVDDGEMQIFKQVERAGEDIV